MVVLGGGTLRRQLGHEDGALIKNYSYELSSGPLYHLRIKEKQ